MKTLNGLHCGWISLSIVEVLKMSPSLIGDDMLIQITSLDSQTNVAKLYNYISNFGANATEYYFSESSLLLTGKTIKQLNDNYDFFVGFDELWCFSEKPIFPKPNDDWLTGPFNISEDTISSQLIEWFCKSKCVLGMGDGIGLNYITSDVEIALTIEGD